MALVHLAAGFAAGHGIRSVGESVGLKASYELVPFGEPLEHRPFDLNMLSVYTL